LTRALDYVQVSRHDGTLGPDVDRRAISAFRETLPVCSVTLQLAHRFDELGFSFEELTSA
jgi:hypothetical protein